jgi:hypothetical protein
VAPKRKGLGKQKFVKVKGWVNEKQNKTTQGLGDKKCCYFQSMTHSNIENYKAMSTVICQYNM